MPLRKLLIAAVLLAVLGGTVWWVARNDLGSAGSDETAAPDLVDIHSDEVQRVVISRTGGQPDVVLQRGAEGTWQITGPEVLRGSTETVNQLLSSLTDLRWDRLLEDKASGLAGYGLDPPSMRVIITGKDGATRTLSIGDQTPSGSAWYATLAGDPRLFTISDFTKGALDKQVADLRDKQLMTFDPETIQRVELSKPGAAVEFTKSGDRWTISRPAAYRADNYQVQDLVDKVHGARMDVNVSPEERAAAPARFASGSRVATVTAVTAEGTQTLEVRKFGEHHYARSNVTEGTYRLEGNLGEALAKSLQDFRNRKLFDFGFNDPSRVEVKDGATSFVFTKSGDQWTHDATTMDSVGVQSLIDKLRDLSAQDFGGPAVTAPDLTLTVTADGKSETVVASGSVAQRSGETAVYRLDPKALEEIRQAAKDVKPAPAAAGK